VWLILAGLRQYSTKNLWLLCGEMHEGEAQFQRWSGIKNKPQIPFDFAQGRLFDFVIALQ
jgi:hypothetical protein